MRRLFRAGGRTGEADSSGAERCRLVTLSAFPHIPSAPRVSLQVLDGTSRNIAEPAGRIRYLRSHSIRTLSEPVYDLGSRCGEGTPAAICVGLSGAVIKEDGTEKSLSKRPEPGAV